MARSLLLSIAVAAVVLVACGNAQSAPPGYAYRAVTYFNDTACLGTVVNYVAQPYQLTQGATCAPAACVQPSLGFYGSYSVACPATYSGWVPQKSTNAYMQSASYGAINCAPASLLANLTVTFAPTGVCQTAYFYGVSNGNVFAQLVYAYKISCSGTTATTNYFSDGQCNTQIASSSVGGCTPASPSDVESNLFAYSGTSCTSAAAGVTASFALLAMTLVAAVAAMLF